MKTSFHHKPTIGISALQKAAPFGLSFSPPTLSLSNCELPSIKTASEVGEVLAEVPAISPIKQNAPVKVQTIAIAG